MENILGIDGHTLKNNVALFPNPATDVLNISNLKEATPYVIYSIEGKKILTGTLNSKQKISLANLSKGIYMLKIENMEAMKFVKE